MSDREINSLCVTKLVGGASQKNSTFSVQVPVSSIFSRVGLPSARLAEGMLIAFAPLGNWESRQLSRDSRLSHIQRGLSGTGIVLVLDTGICGVLPVVCSSLASRAPVQAVRCSACTFFPSLKTEKLLKWQHPWCNTGVGNSIKPSHSCSRPAGLAAI